MATITVSLPTDTTTAEVADYNTPITTIVNEINGGLDSNNLAANAVTTAKITNANVTGSKIDFTTSGSLGYAETNATITNIFSTYLKALTVTVTIPAGVTRIKLEGLVAAMSKDAAGLIIVDLRVGGVSAISSYASVPGATQYRNLYATRRLDVTPGQAYVFDMYLGVDANTGTSVGFCTLNIEAC